MKIKEFLEDYIEFIIFHVFIMIIISLIMFFDNEVKISIGNIIYLNVLVLVIFLVYLLQQFLKKKKQLDQIAEILDKQQENIVDCIGEPLSNEQKLYFMLLRKMETEYCDKLNGFNVEKKEFSDFINYWVHEIKTPIAASKLVLESESKSKDEILDIVEEKIMSIENYVEQALYYLRTDNFSKDYFIGEINISQFINNIIKKSAKLFITKRIKIQLEDLEFSIHSDIKWLNFIVEQIILNSLKYTDNNGTIKIYGYSNDKEQCIVIEDNGIGIKQEDIKRVFDKGFTGYNGRQNLKATGIGLYLSKKLSNKLGHDISIESVYSEYTKVFIHFPRMMDYFSVVQ